MDVGQFDLYRKDKRTAIKPLWSADKWKTDAGFIAWFYEQLPIFEDIHSDRIYRCINNLMWYTGEYDGNSEYRLIHPNGSSQINISKYMVPVVVNHLYDLTEQRVSSLAALKPNFNVRAHNDEEASDRTSSKHLKTMIEAVRRMTRLDAKLSELDRWCAIFGEAFLTVEWDEKLGRVGKEKPIGDIRISLKEPFWIMYEPEREWEKVNCLIEIHEILHVDKVKKKYNVDIEKDNLNTVWSFDNSGYQKDPDEIVVYRYMEKPNEYNEDGCIVYVAGNKVLKREDKWPYKHREFPYERITDIDPPGKLFPISTYNFLIPLQHQYNKMTSMMHRAITMFSHAKWFMTKGACKPEALGNSSTIVQVAPGAPNPQLISSNAIPQEMFRYRDSMRQEMATIGATQGVSRGEPPTGARAASMLKFYDEQEQQRRGNTIDKRNELIRRTYSKIGSVIQEYYPKNEERIVRHIGRSHRYDLLRLSEIDIDSPYDIDIENASAFSESRSARMEEVAFYLEKIPGALTPAQAADVLGIASPEKYYDIATAALKAAEYENSDMLDGRPIQAPEPSDDSLVHWQTHIICMQTDGYKKLPDRLKEAFKEHLKMTEQLMYEQAMKSAALAQILSGLPNFPIFAEPEQLPISTPPEAEGKGPGRPKGPPQPPSDQAPAEQLQ